LFIVKHSSVCARPLWVKRHPKPGKAM
jgi:hypothetical protein